MGKAFVANYDGVCPECGDDIVAALDDIVMTDDGAVHEECAPDADDEPVTFPL